MAGVPMTSATLLVMAGADAMAVVAMSMVSMTGMVTVTVVRPNVVEFVSAGRGTPMMVAMSGIVTMAVFSERARLARLR